MALLKYTVQQSEREAMTIIFRKILAPTDLSEPSFQALRRAMTLASNCSAELVVLSVLPNSQRDDQTEADATQGHLDDVVRDYAPPSLTTSTLVRWGDVTGEILRVARDENCDLIVMATHGATGWREFVLGSVAGEIVRLASCPVLTIGSVAR
jgi:nucleotide-binding universal stress UspA family protein